MSLHLDKLLRQAREVVPEIPLDAAFEAVCLGQAVPLDVREEDEWNGGHLPGAKHVSRGLLELRIEEAVPEKDTPLVLYCAGGNRSLLAGQTLRTMGYTDVRSLHGGYAAWARAGLPTEQDRVLTPDQRDRYSRHLTLPQVGLAGQAKLLDAKVLLVGAGGLGSPAALYLAAAGVGTLGIIDHDVVDRSNLQRQVIHDTPRIGTPKAESARETLERLNPDVSVRPYNERLNLANVQHLLKAYDLVVDGSDNFDTRYLLNDAAYFAGKPVVHGSIFRFEGQMITLHPSSDGPCYRCIFPEMADGDDAPNCSEAGVLGVLPGTVGLIQATEALKLILGIGDPLIGRLLHYDALRLRFREFAISKDPDCPLCGTNPTISPLNEPTSSTVNSA
jgi:molybdopterin/thiamine biosynthesis adenylyltransferase/rhodanese-related sulfurtransferase